MERQLTKIEKAAVDKASGRYIAGIGDASTSAAGLKPRVGDTAPVIDAFFG